MRQSPGKKNPQGSIIQINIKPQICTEVSSQQYVVCLSYLLTQIYKQSLMPTF